MNKRELNYIYENIGDFLDYLLYSFDNWIRDYYFKIIIKY
jgi:hypothetical protein